MEELARGERLRAAGQIVSGVAHELNNPLHSILLMADDLLLDERSDADREAIDVVRAQARRARSVVQNLLAFVRGEAMAPAIEVDLVPLVASSVEELRCAVESYGVAFTVELPPSGPRALASPEGLSQILANLLMNAAQAAGDRGTVTLRLECHDAPVIVVEDDGPGIAESALPHVFEPYFTTKAEGHGTGIGLSVALACARAMDCGLTVENRADGRGARATLRWPARDAMPAQTPRAA